MCISLYLASTKNLHIHQLSQSIIISYREFDINSVRFSHAKFLNIWQQKIQYQNKFNNILRIRIDAKRYIYMNDINGCNDNSKFHIGVLCVELLWDRINSFHVSM